MLYTLPNLSTCVGLARASTDGDKLTIHTGNIEREWTWTGYGFATTKLCNVHSGRQWGSDWNRVCDWDIPGVTDSPAEAKLISLHATPSDDEGFTSLHLCVTAEIEYPTIGISIKYMIWAYPGASGLRTQLRVKALEHFRPPQLPMTTGIPSDAWVITTTPDSVPVRGGFKSQPIVQTEPPERPFTVLVDLQHEHTLTGLGIVPINNSRSYGLVQECQVAVSEDGNTWGDPIYEGNINPLQRKGITFEAHIDFCQAVKARFVRLTIPYTVSSLSQDWGVAADVLRLYSSQYPAASPQDLRSETICGDFAGCETKAIGYYGGTQARNSAETPILQKLASPVPADGMNNDWASVFCVDSKQGGLMLVQESHKMVNQPGHDTGRFTITRHTLTASGWGLLPEEITTNCYRECWANWVLVYTGGDDERQLVIKQFDRLRYPPDPMVGLFCQANTWSETGPGHAGNAAESEVLKELPSVADLGLDMLVIDHGWQVSRDEKGFIPAGGWKPHPDQYPQGWQNVVATARDFRVKLGVWAVAQSIPLDMMEWNFDQAGFMSVKLDFARLNSHDEIRELMYRVREYIKYTGFRSQICWDTTEVAPRYGYFFAREYGYLHVMNRKPTKPVPVTYIPWLVLRDHWHLAHYTNTNQYQMICQNIDITNPNISDAYLHNHQYVLAMTLMGLPEFLQSTYVYSDEARKQLRPLISLWKKHREAMFNMFVFPIGDEPNNASWTGFQFVVPGQKAGYLLVFRELHSPQVYHNVNLRFLCDCTLTLTDLCTDISESVRLLGDGSLGLVINQPAGFKFVRYEVS